MSFAARLNKRVIVQQRVAGHDEIGQPLPDAWSNLFPGDGKVWAEVRDVSGREFVAAGATQSKIQTTIAVRYREDIKERMRVLCGTDVYDIEAVLVQSPRLLHLMCSRVAQ